MSVQAIMTATILSAEPTATVRDAIRLIEDSDIRHLPIVDGRRLVGIVSDRDLREYRIPLAFELDSFDAGARARADALLDTPLREAMSASVVSVDIRDDIESVIDALIETKIGAVPVVDGDELVGIVSYIDVLRYARKLLHAE